MALSSRSARISILLVIDLFFFLIELVVGYAVGSLALVADSFHMLNDVMSLIVALYAIKLSSKDSTSDSRYSYGWHRAEILAALINGVFLLALCFSISLEALGRFFSTPEISNPKLIVIVGSLGLASNIVGLFLFHEHGHSHGHSHSEPPPTRTASPSSQPDTATLPGDATPTPKKSRPLSIKRRETDDDSLYGHPAATRASLVQTANVLAHARSPPPEGHLDVHRHLSREHSRSSSAVQDNTSTSSNVNEETPLIRENSHDYSYTSNATAKDHTHDHEQDHNHSGGHHHGHSHGSMNMRALVLHVMGDALGNLGVIGTGLIIWLTEWKYKFYFDPVISLVITVIIFSSSLPLVRSASFILLQGVPSNISLDSVRSSIQSVQGVNSVHELHIWQLSETKVVASVHITADRDYDFMSIASQIRTELHHHGIHSCTIQPEYFSPRLERQDSACLILCPSDQACNPAENACCPPPPATV